MRRGVLVAFFLCLIAGPASASATFDSSYGARFAGGGTPQTISSVAVSGANTLMIVHIAAVSQFNTTQYATGVTWSLPSSTGLTKRAEKRNTIDGQIALAQTWFLKAPGAGTGTVTVTFNVTGGSADCVVLVELWTGVDQTDPVPVGDIVQKDTDETTAVATPTNLVTGDATTGISVETAGGYSAWGPNGLWASGSLPGTVEVYATNTTGLSWTFTGLGHSNHAITAVRIKGAAGGNIAGGLVNTPMLKGLVGGGLVP